MRQFILFLSLLFIVYSANAQTPPTPPTPVSLPTIATFTAGMDKQPGFLTFYYDAKKGKIWLEIDKFDTELLYYPTLAQGVGSNDIGLDRGRLGGEHIVKFVRSGPKVLMIEPNYGYRALTRDSLERRAVEESFAQSVHAGFEIAAEGSGRVLVDLTPFLMQDGVGAVQAIAQTRQGTYKIDPMRCALYLPHSKSFPQNTEFEATITLTGDNPGPYLRQVVPTPTVVTMRQHHSFVQLPDNGYKPRLFDPRAGVGSIDFFDYASPVGDPITKRYITRHRLQKKDPSAAISEAVKPIIYYMDPGAPEPIRSALMEGTAWWNQAFEAAGYKNAFQVKLLPPDADPMDVRYNLIQWVHRSTRGWSYGASITDPRTGEIIKGKVTLGSLRVRQDYLIAQGLVGNFGAASADTADLMNMSLDRLRQLAAHEVGHTLGLPHNYVASVSNRSSVMDYPHPQVDIVGGNKLSLANAYAKNIGDWDKVAINYAYREFPTGTNETTELNKIITGYLKQGLKFLSDQDARPEGSAHPQTHLWDGGTDAADELNRVMKVRRIALDNFSEAKIPMGMPMANLEEVLVPMYMFHRYQVEAAVKLIGGQDYSYALRGDGQVVTQAVSAEQQRKALNAVLNTLLPAELVVPAKIAALIPPRAFGMAANPREIFKRHTGITFDPIGPPEAAADMTLRLLLNPERCARLAQQPLLSNGTLPGLAQVLDRLIQTTFGDKKPFSQQQGAPVTVASQLSQMMQQKTLEHLIQLAAGKENMGIVRAAAHRSIMTIKADYARKNTSTIGYPESPAVRDEYPDFLYWMIQQYEGNPDTSVATMLLTAPDGAPIDSGQEWLEPGCGWQDQSTGRR
ncbi:MAG: zinc-dependent metalloprotease [Bacteroidetes bacterium]|nr:zinc-dependent metalloprotease [Fibrella sp.]